MNLLQQGAYLEEISLSSQERHLREALRQVQGAGAQVIQNVPEHLTIAVNENISSVISKNRDLPSEHGT